MTSRPVIDDLSSFWMPFTANRQFKAAPRLLESAKGMYYRIDRRPRGARRLRGPVVRERRSWPRRDRRSDHQQRSPRSTSRRPSRWATRSPSKRRSKVAGLMPDGLDRIFFTNSGSESVDTALKIALAYHRARGEGAAHASDRPRARLSRRGLRRHLGRRHRAEPQDLLRRAAAGRRSSAAHAQPRTQRVFEGPARVGRASRRRTGTHRHAARCIDDRRRDRRAGGGFDGRARAAARAICKSCARSARSTASC